MDTLGLQGYVGSSDRGTVSGTYFGVLLGCAVTIGFRVCKFTYRHGFPDFQRIDLELCGSILDCGLQVSAVECYRLKFVIECLYSGSFTRDLVKPGTYTATLYQGELEVRTGSVAVSVGQISSLTLTSNLTSPYVIWSIGICFLLIK
jgi:rhamnogalacturonan endolyase